LAQDRNKGILFHRNQDECTRGIEISLVQDSDIDVSVWDLSGQEEYHAFHDYMMPKFGDVVNPCSFLFLFDLTREMHWVKKIDPARSPKYSRKNLFIGSNS
jgi:GTPase SAR1 family protein